jgi:hypothetical protein
MNLPILRLRGALPGWPVDGLWDRTNRFGYYHALPGDDIPRRRQDAHLFELAKRGAEVRFRELVQEAKNLIGLFPHLRDSFDKDELPLSFILAKGAGRLTRANTPTSATANVRCRSESRQRVDEAVLGSAASINSGMVYDRFGCAAVGTAYTVMVRSIRWQILNFPVRPSANGV